MEPEGWPAGAWGTVEWMTMPAAEWDALQAEVAALRQERDDQFMRALTAKEDTDGE